MISAFRRMREQRARESLAAGALAAGAPTLAPQVADDAPPLVSAGQVELSSEPPAAVARAGEPTEAKPPHGRRVR